MQNNFNFIPSETEGIFFSGILGCSLSSLALISKLKGYKVSGSDSGDSPEVMKKLTENGIKVYPCHAAENLVGFDTLVYSAAISEKCPEIKYARENGMKIFTRSEFLGRIISEYGEKIGVSGTHGKSTVSGMITEIFLAEGRDVTALIGAQSVSLDGGYRLGSGDTVIYEACEYKRSFLDFLPSTSVVLNIEKEHVDCYPSLLDAATAYREFVKNAEACVLNFDDAGCRDLGNTLNEKEIMYFSLSEKRAEVYAENICEKNGIYSFDVFFVGNKLCSVRLSVPGIHNVKNALAATATAILSGVSAEGIEKGLSRFKGMKRRFEYVGACGGAAVFDDYAHHPTEIKATLDSARRLGYKKIICAFQPHTYSRTAAFFNEFAEAFRGADEVIFTDIYAAREENIYGVSGKMLADATENGVYISDFGEVERYLRERAEAGTLIITLGAGRLNEVAGALTGKI